MFGIENQSKSQLNNSLSPTHWIWYILLAGLLLRIVLAPIWIGYDTDVKTFMAWADRAAAQGLSGLYVNGEDYFLDYPPGYMYVLYLIGKLHHGLHIIWGSAISLILLKLPAMLADLGLSYAIYLAARAKERFTPKQAAGIAALYALNPAVWVNSAVWGQVDAVFMISILWTFVYQQRGKLPQASMLIAVALLLKPQALLFGPFLLIDVLQRKSWKLLAACLLSGISVIAVLVLPFCLQKGIAWLPELYVNTLSSYPYASLNAFNLLALAGGNFVDLNETVMGISYQWWGTLFMIGAFVASCWLYIASKRSAGTVYYMAFLFITAVFVCTAKMHERYLYYGLLLVLMSFVYIKDRRMLGLFIGFSLTHFINVGYVLLSSFNQHYHIPRYDGLMLTVSAANVLLLAYAYWLGWRLFVKRDKEMATNIPALHRPFPSKGKWEDDSSDARQGRFFTKKDVLYVIALVLVYTIIALYHLGSHQDPKTFWKPSSSGEAVIADLGAYHAISRINSFAGVGEGSYTYSFSSDKKEWYNSATVESDHTKVFTWNTVEPKVQARYVKISVEKTGVILHEIGIFGETDTSPLHVRAIESVNSNASTEGTPDNLFDEADVVPYTPSYMNGTYFDEIYHARTAYEHLHQIEPYESTHPPLGKIFISIGIWLFGLNPFGWRIIGTLFGIGMIPIMYAFGKRLFHKSEFAFISAFLFTFDFMHFAQTRIATIDVYGVFFIIIMFYYMYRYTTMSFYNQSLRKTLVPLGLSGLFFGIGAASKWIVIYGGAGLALLLLLALWERYIEYRAARKALREDAALAIATVSTLNAESAKVEEFEEVKEFKESEESVESEVSVESAVSEQPNETLEPLTEEERGRLTWITRIFPKYTLLTLVYCLLTFVLIPVIIYTLSYIPFMMVPGPGHGLKDVITYQKHIYEYHKNLHATHPFSSSWYEWPMMLRPIWFYQAHFMPEGKLSSIISFGNPLVWWPGFIAVLVSFFVVFRRKDKKLRMLLIAYCSQYLPWILVPRLTFIYHYFAMVPFLVFILTYYIKDFMEDHPEKKKWVYGYLAAVLLLFIIFYPLLSGAVISKSYSFWLRWLPGWNYF